MARARLESYRLGKTAVTSAGGTQTIGSVSLATLTSGMTTNHLLYVDTVIALFCEDDQADVYAILVTLTTPIRYSSTGPTYFIGQTSYSVINIGSGDEVDYFTGITLDQSGGNLRVRITPGVHNLQAYAVLNTFSP